jgi:hypothetical protein
MAISYQLPATPGLVLVNPVPPRKKRSNKKSTSRMFSEPRTPPEQGNVADQEPRHLPITYGDCRKEVGDGPCPYISCRHHLLAELMGNGVKVHHWEGIKSGEAFDGSLETCSIRLAERTGGMDMVAVGQALGNVTSERARIIEASALRKLARVIGQGAVDCLTSAKKRTENLR